MQDLLGNLTRIESKFLTLKGIYERRHRRQLENNLERSVAVKTRRYQSLAPNSDRGGLLKAILGIGGLLSFLVPWGDAMAAKTEKKPNIYIRGMGLDLETGEIPDVEPDVPERAKKVIEDVNPERDIKFPFDDFQKMYDASFLGMFDKDPPKEPKIVIPETKITEDKRTITSPAETLEEETPSAPESRGEMPHPGYPERVPERPKTVAPPRKNQNEGSSPPPVEPAPERKPEEKKEFAYPLSKRFNMTSRFGLRTDPMNPSKKQGHRGMDIGSPMGTPVLASRSGVVAFSGYHKNAGWAVNLAHSGKYETRYFHLSKINVRQGQQVNQGDVIAESGNSGARTTGPHLHFEILLNGQHIDPEPFIGNAQVRAPMHKEEGKTTVEYKKSTSYETKSQGMIRTPNRVVLSARQ